MVAQGIDIDGVKHRSRLSRARREKTAETLIVLQLHQPPTLARTFRSTKTVESMISICRDHANNVKRWRDGQMALRWCAAPSVPTATLKT